MSSGEESDSSSFKDDAARTSNQTTWAGRNPSLATQPSRSRTSLTAAEKASRALVQVDRKKRAELLYADVDALLVLWSAQVEELAKKFHEKPEKIEKRLGFQRTKTRRGVTLQNALNHHISKEINAGTLASRALHNLTMTSSTDRPVGSKANLQEIIKIRQTDSRYQGLSVSEQQPYLDGLLEDRALKKSGLRISNRSAAQDFRAVVASVSDMVSEMALTQLPSQLHRLTAWQIAQARTPWRSLHAGTSTTKPHPSGLPLVTQLISSPRPLALTLGTLPANLSSGRVPAPRVRFLPAFCVPHN